MKTTFFTNYGVIEAANQETANRLAYIHWLEEGWAQGGYYPMTREEFEAEHPEVRGGR
jgi:hypothetical protein